jgi:two-component system CheB/CheR fusion protein
LSFETPMSQFSQDTSASAPAATPGEERFRLIYQYAPIGIAQVELASGKLLDVNDMICRILRADRQKLIGRKISELIHPDDWKHEAELLDQMSSGKIDRYQIEKRYERPDGTQAWVRVMSTRVDEPGRPPFRLSVVEDITDRKAAEAALKQQEEQLRAILETAVDAIITIDERGRMESVNSATVRLFGYQREEMIGQNVSMLMPEPDHSHHDRYLKDYTHTGRASIIGIGRDVRARRKDGTIFPVHLAVNEVRLAKGRLFTGILHDLTERRHLEGLVSEASAREQQRIGQDLHDGLGQQLAGLSFFCKSLVTRLESHAAAEAADARRMNELITSALQHTRGLARGLNPIGEGRQGLASALRELAAWVTNTFGTPCRYEETDPVDIDDTAVANHAYRIAQEAVTNAVKHAKPWNVTISLGFDRGQVVLIVEDDGSGIPENSTSGGSGRDIMRARAAFIGGKLDIAPGRAGGTIVRCRFPQPPLKEATP